MCSGIEPVDAARAGEDGAPGSSGEASHCSTPAVSVWIQRRRGACAQPGGGPPGEQRLGAAEEVAGSDFSGTGTSQWASKPAAEAPRR